MSNYSEQHQHHSGAGDNVGRDKIVNTSISPEQIKDSVIAIFSKRRNGEIESATELLEGLATTAELDTESRSILHSASCALKVAKGEELEEGAFSIILRDLRSSGSSFCKDIHCSSLIRIYCKKDQVKEAKELYNTADLDCELSNEAYYELVADEVETEAYFNTNKSSLLEGELCGLLIGLIRQESKRFQLIKSISEQLCNVSTNYNSDYLKFLSEAYSHTAQHLGTHYWKLKAEARSKLLFFCDIAAELLEKCKGKDKRLQRSAIQLIDIVYGEHEGLLLASWKFVEQFEADHPDFALSLRQHYGNDDQQQSDLSTLQLIKRDPDYKRNKLREYSETATIKLSDAYVLRKTAAPTLIKDWIEKGGDVEAETELEREFALLELKLKAYSTSKESYQILGQAVENFITKNEQDLYSIYPDRLVDVAAVLVDSDMADQAVRLLQPHISDCDLWSSRLTRCYLNALLVSNQHLTLADTIAKFGSKERDGFVCQIHANLHAIHQDKQKAISCLEECVDIDPLVSSAWANLISLYIENGVEGEKIKNTLSKVPLEILKTPSFHAYRLLGHISLFGSFELAEKTLIEWFIRNPDDCAMDFTNFHFSIMIENGFHPTVSEELEGCLGGVVYKKNNQQTVTKIIVTDDAIQHQDLITESSPLGSKLLEMKPGEIAQLGMFKIELIEKLPPFVACLRVAMKLREELNDGTDCFHSISLPDDPEGMLETLKEFMSFERPERQREADSSIPLYLKGPIGEGGCTPQAINHVLDLFTNKLVPKGKPSSLGEKKPKKVILDIYGIVYIALIEASEQLLNFTNITITPETHKVLEDWLQRICDEDYLTLGVSANGGLIRNTFDDIQSKTQGIQLQVRKLLEASQVESPNLVDMPTQFAQIQKVLNGSVTSSIRLAISNEISWFCMDHTFAQLTLELGATPVNVEEVLRVICQQMCIEDKRSAIYLHVQTKLPLSISFNDLRDLSIDKDERSHYFLSELIRRYPENYENPSHALSFLTDIASKAIAQSFIEGAILDGLSYKNPNCKYYTERLVNTCLHTYACLGQEETSEKRIAAFLFNVFTTFKTVDRARQIVSQIAFRFIKGHFLNLDSVNANLKSMYANRTSR